MKLPHWKPSLSVGTMTALGGAIGYLQSHLEGHLPSSAAAWESVGLGAALTFVASLLHLYQDPNPPSTG
jgi:hypothetical protein